MADRRDFYEVLGVGGNASQEEIQRSYRRLARTYHPDVNKDPEAEARFQEIAEAYDVLSDPDTRRRYDTFGHDFRQVPEDVDPEDWARARATATSGARARRSAGAGAGPRAWSTGGAEDIDIEDLFGDIFGTAGGGPRRRGWGSIPGADQEVELPLSVEEAYRGGHRRLSISGPSGPRSIEVDIPAGVTDGQRIRLAGQGGHGTGGAAAGDLYLVVRIQPHPRYRVEGRDIYVDLPLAPWEAALGTSVAVESPGGEAKVRVPPGSSSGRRLRLRGRGLPNPRGDAGDFFAEVRILVPRSLTERERELFEELARISTFDPRSRR